MLEQFLLLLQHLGFGLLTLGDLPAQAFIRLIFPFDAFIQC